MKKQLFINEIDAIGFFTIYEGHDRRTWANYWSPLLSASLCGAANMLITSSTVLTTARPEIIQCTNSTSGNINACNETCEEYEYLFDPNWVTETVTTQYDLVCDHAIVNHIGSIGFLGFMFCSIYSGFLADRYGRTPMMIVSYSLSALVGFLTCYFNNYGVNVFIAGRFFMMFFNTHSYLGFQHCMERMAPRYRATMAMIVETSAAGIGIMLLSLIGYIFSTWIEFLLVISTSLALCVPIFVFVPRSFRWFFSKNMVKEGKTCLKEFCVASDYNYDEEVVDQILEKERRLQEKMNLATKNVFRYPKVCLVLAKLSVAWFAACMVYYGIMFSPSKKVLINNAMFGLLSTIAGPMMCILMRSRFAHRRLALSTLYMITGLFVLSMGFMSRYEGSVATFIFGGIAYGIISGAFSLLFLYTSELVPTVIRCSGFGTLSGIGKIGTILGHQVLNLNTEERPWSSGIIFGIITLIASAIIFTLPETHERPLTQTLDEAEMVFTQMAKDEKDNDQKSEKD